MAATTVIPSNEKRNVLKAHCSMIPRMFDNMYWRRREYDWKCAWQACTEGYLCITWHLTWSSISCVQGQESYATFETSRKKDLTRGGDRLPSRGSLAYRNVNVTLGLPGLQRRDTCQLLTSRIQND